MSDSETIPMDRGPAGPGAQIPQRLGSVRLIRELGRGGMGVVWLGHDEFLGRDVAVKFLLGAAASESDPAFTTFLEGARAAAAVKHPGLNSVLNAGVVDGVPYLVMEFIDGAALDQLIRSGPVPADVAWFILQKVCASVAVLHENAIVHRDIKPGNILLDRDGNVVVSDFGLSCQRRYGEAQSSVGVAGSPAYMAPEMFDGDVSARSDVYALGVLAFELFTGSMPFVGGPVELRGLHRTAELPGEPLATLPAGIADLIRRAMTKDPRVRTRTASHMVIALDQARPKGLSEPRMVEELKRRVARARAGGVGPADPTPAADSQAYYQSLATIASQKRAEDSGQITDSVVCVKCKYDLKGLRFDGACPECGTPVKQSVTSAPSDVSPTRDQKPTLRHSVDCISCGYDLRGLSPEGNCPECAAPVAPSIAPGRLLFADARWLKRIILGQRITFIGIVCWLLALPVFGILFMFVTKASPPAAGAGPAAPPEDDLAVGAASAFMLLVGLWPCLSLIGIWLFTRPEPRQPFSAMRCLGRWAVLVGLILAVALAPREVRDAGVARYLKPVVEVSFALAVLALASHLRALARRIPDRRLVRRASSVRIVAIGLLCLAPIFTAADLFMGSTMGPFASGGNLLTRLAVPLRAVVSIVNFAAMLYTLVLIGISARQFRSVRLRTVLHGSLLSAG